jgi:hypothetical protein
MINHIELDIRTHAIYSDRALNSAAMTWNLELFCNNFHQLGTDVTFKHSCNIPACDVKCDGNCISGLSFMRGTLFDPTFGGLSGRYPTGQEIIPFEVHWSPWEGGLAYLSRCNSGWFYHKRADLLSGLGRRTRNVRVKGPEIGWKPIVSRLLPFATLNLLRISRAEFLELVTD